MSKTSTTPTKSVDSNLHWYVVHTYSGHEDKVRINLGKRIASFNLADQIQEVFVPTQEKIEIKQGKKRQVQERVFPGYVMVEMMMNDATYSCVRHTPGVTSFVGTVNRAIPLSSKEAEAIFKFTKQKAPKFKAEFSLGEAVKIIDGPFADFVGAVDEINEDAGKLKVLVSIFGRETPVELDFLQVSKL